MMRSAIVTFRRVASQSISRRPEASLATRSLPISTSHVPFTFHKHFSTSADDEKNEQLGDGIDSFTRSEMEKRHKGIQMNKDSISQHVLPGYQMVKTNQKTGTKKVMAIERSMGYFWYIKDLKDTQNKPVVSNDELIPLEDAQVFPTLNGLNDGSLNTVAGEEESLPHFFTKDNRAKDPSAICTLVGVNFNEFGNQMLPSWMDPFENAFQKDKNRVKTVWLSINEGRTLSLLKFFINRSFQNNVKEERKDRTLLFFGSCPEFKDILRMHNDKTAYVFLLDGLGRVRFAGSGKATDEELRKLIRFAKELTPGLKSKAGSSASLKISKKKSTDN